MTDEQTKPAAAPAADAAAAADDTIVITAEIVDDQGLVGEGGVAIQGNHVLLVARFVDTATAEVVYHNLQDGEVAGKYHIAGVLVAKSDQGGNVTIQKLTDHHTRRGLKWGVVAGVVAGIVFPPSILASAVVLGGAGAAAGKIGNVREKAKVEAAVADVLTPGTSGILALIEVDDLPAIKETMPQAEAVKTIPVDEATAVAIEKAAGDEATTATA